MAQTLWDFAAECYQRPTVAECCLRLQDNVGADVNMLLAAAWLAQRSRNWQREQVRDLVKNCVSWREQCILPLRAVRRYLKGQLESSELYARAKALELDVEIQQLQQIQITLLANDNGANNEPAISLLSTNLDLYFDCIAVPYRKITPGERAALIAALSQQQN